MYLSRLELGASGAVGCCWASYVEHSLNVKIRQLFLFLWIWLIYLKANLILLKWAQFLADDDDLATDEDDGEARAFKVYLECYQYLKIFSIWGHETLAELKNDPDTYDHIADLWNQLSLSSSKADQVCQF